MNKTKPKSVLHVVSVYFSLPYFIGEQFQYFSNKDYKMHVICSPSNELKEYARVVGFQFEEIPILRSISIYRDLLSIYSIYKYIKRNNIDIVCGHSPKGALLSMIASFLARVHTRLYFRHGLVYETSRGLKKLILINIERLTALFSSKVIAVSPSIIKLGREKYLNCNRPQILLANGTCNGVNTVKFSITNINADIRNNILSNYKIPVGAFVIGFTGRLVNDKGIVELVSGFDQLRKKYDQIYLFLVGMLDTRDTLSDHVVKLIKENNHIITTGYVDNREIEHYYSVMNVFVLPSYREGFPTSILEASAMEIPVITTKVTGCIDAIIESKTGIYVGHDANEIEKAIEYFYLNPQKAREFGKNGREFILESFNQQLVWDSIENLYK